MKTKTQLSAEEFSSRLNASPEAIAVARARYGKIQQGVREYRDQAAPVVKSPRNAGVMLTRLVPQKEIPEPHTYSWNIFGDRMRKKS